MCRTQFFEYFEWLDNLLIINILYSNSLSPSPNTTLEPLTFKFLFRRFSKKANYTFLNIPTDVNCFFLYFPVSFYFQRAVVKISAHSK